MSEYWWDGTGTRDPEVERLMAVLRPVRRLPPAPELPLTGASRRSWRALAAAAAVAAALAALPRPRPGSAGWEIEWAAAGGGPADVATTDSRLRAGEWLDTGRRQARLLVGRIGQVRLEPSTRVRIVDAGALSHRLAVAHGTLHATIWAPPGQFLVETPAALVVDLGCAYTLEVAPEGSGLLHVEAGWVGFEHGDRRALVPAGASCRVRPGLGPGTPRFDSAPAVLAAALDVLDAGADRHGGIAERQSALSCLERHARPRDALSLWHLLGTTDRAERERVFAALAALVPPPPGVTREGIVRGDEALRDLWWDELGLGSADFWRQWTRKIR